MLTPLEPMDQRGRARLARHLVVALLAAAPGWAACSSGGGGATTSSGTGGASTTSTSSSTGGATTGCGPGTTPCGSACVDTALDPLNCGACGNACPAGQVCAASQCTLECSGGTTKCGEVCVDTQHDPANCGGCDKACATGEVCSAGQCALECSGDTTKCGDACTNTSLDPANCGGCGTVCPSKANASAACDDGLCGFACNTGYDDCNADASDGCEVDVSSSLSNCGACGHACPSPTNGAPACSSGVCGVGACNTGFGDCDQDPANGCEANLLDDTQNCGACGNACSSGQTCSGGKCQLLYWASGVQQNIAPASLAGWTQCYSGNYNTTGSLTTVLAQCSKSKLLMACKPAAQTNYSLLAMGPRADVLFDCGTTVNCTKQSNGVGWYYNASYSWGFAPGGEPVNRSSCDYDGGTQTVPNLRVCWHTSGNSVASGYRCGANDLVGNAAWVRDVWHAD